MYREVPFPVVREPYKPVELLWVQILAVIVTSFLILESDLLLCSCLQLLVKFLDLFCDSLHVLLVHVSFVVGVRFPPSAKRDSLKHSGQSSRPANYSRFPEACLQCWISHEPMMV